MGQDTVTTKEALLEAAGELFAEAGLEGVSIRAIAEKCKVNIAAVNYHFGSKENLYLEVVRHVMTKTQCRLADAFLTRKEAWCGQPQRCAEMVYRLVEERINQFFPGNHPRWYGRMFMRVLLSPTPALWKLVEEIVMPDFESLQEVLRCCKPGMTVPESELWTDSLIGLLSHYVFSEQFIEYIPERCSYNAEFKAQVLRHVSRMLIKGLDLPLPEVLQEGGTHA